MPLVDVKVPDIGDFSEVPVIDVLVKAGDAVKREDPLVTVESEKATMDIPSPADGVVRTITVKIGDKVSEGHALLTLESGAPAQAAAPSKPVSATPAPPTPAPSKPAPSKPASPAPSPATAKQPPQQSATAASKASAAGSATTGRYTGRADIECEGLVLGSGPGGYSAAFRAADL